MRRPSEQERPLDTGDSEVEGTIYLLPAAPVQSMLAHCRALFSAPRRYVRALLLALTVRPPGLRALLYQFFYFAEAGLVAEIMRREQLVHIHNHAPDSSGFVAMIAAEMGGFSFSMTLHGFGILSEPSRWRLREKLERALFTVCVSWHARSQAMLWSSRETWSKFHVVHCGVDLDGDCSPKERLPGQRLVFVGRLDHVKGLPILVDTIAELVKTKPKVHLDIVGDGPERQDLNSLIREAGLASRVTFHGYLAQPAVRAILEQSDVFVMTSLAEGIPVVLMEALAAGVPVVAPRITGIPELVEHCRSGLLFTPAKKSELISAIETLLDDPELAKRISIEGRKLVDQDFNLETETRRLVALIRARLTGQAVNTRPEADDKFG